MSDPKRPAGDDRRKDGEQWSVNRSRGRRLLVFAPLLFIVVALVVLAVIYNVAF